MTGRDLIIYILQNNLEDEVIFEDGKIPGYMTLSEAALKFGVTSLTVYIWYEAGNIPGLPIGNTIYIPIDAEIVNK